MTYATRNTPDVVVPTTALRIAYVQKSEESAVKKPNTTWITNAKKNVFRLPNLKQLFQIILKKLKYIQIIDERSYYYVVAYYNLN